MIDHFSGSDRRYPDRAVWRTAPAKILPVCGTGGRCGNQRSEASSHLRRRGVCLLRAACQHVVFRTKIHWKKSQEAIRECRIRSGSLSAAYAVRGVHFYRCVCPHVFFAKTGRRARGRCENTEIGSGKQSAACPVQGVRFYRSACPHAVFRTKKSPGGNGRGS